MKKKANDHYDNDSEGSDSETGVVKKKYSDDEDDDLVGPDDISVDEKNREYIPTTEAAIKYRNDKFIARTEASFGTLIICTYCKEEFTIATAVGHFRNQCEIMMKETGRNDEHRKAIKTKNTRATDSSKTNHARFMAKFRDLKKESWYLFKNKLLKPPVGSCYPKLPTGNIFYIGLRAREGMGTGK